MSQLSKKRLIIGIFSTLIVALVSAIFFREWLNLGWLGVPTLFAIAFYYVTGALANADRAYFSGGQRGYPNEPVTATGDAESVKLAKQLLVLIDNLVIQFRNVSEKDHSIVESLAFDSSLLKARYDRIHYILNSMLQLGNQLDGMIESSYVMQAEIHNMNTLFTNYEVQTEKYFSWRRSVHVAPYDENWAWLYSFKRMNYLEKLELYSVPLREILEKHIKAGTG